MHLYASLCILMHLNLFVNLRSFLFVLIFQAENFRFRD